MNFFQILLKAAINLTALLDIIKLTFWANFFKFHTKIKQKQ